MPGKEKKPSIMNAWKSIRELSGKNMETISRRENLIWM